MIFDFAYLDCLDYIVVVWTPIWTPHLIKREEKKQGTKMEIYLNQQSSPSTKITFNELCDLEDSEEKGLLNDEQKVLLSKAIIQLESAIKDSGLLFLLSKFNAQYEEFFKKIKPTLERLASWSKKKERHFEEYQILYPNGFYCFTHRKIPETVSKLRELTYRKLKRYGVYRKHENSCFDNLYSKSLGKLPEDLFMDEYVNVYENAEKALVDAL